MICICITLMFCFYVALCNSELSCSKSQSGKDLSLISRNLTKFPTDLPVHVRDIYLGNNLIDKFPNFGKSCTRDQLLTLKINSNKLTVLSLENIMLTFPKLKRLAASENLITSLKRKRRNNKSTRCDFTESSLEILDLGKNQIRKIQKEVLDVVMNLEELRLNNNLLETIPGLTFTCFKELKTLDLAFNRLTSIHYKWFAGLRSLEFFTLEGNPIKTIDSNFLSKICIKQLETETVDRVARFLKTLKIKIDKKNKNDPAEGICIEDKKRHNYCYLNCTTCTVTQQNEIKQRGLSQCVTLHIASKITSNDVKEFQCDLRNLSQICLALSQCCSKLAATTSASSTEGFQYESQTFQNVTNELSDSERRMKYDFHFVINMITVTLVITTIISFSYYIYVSFVMYSTEDLFEQNSRK